MPSLRTLAAAAALLPALALAEVQAFRPDDAPPAAKAAVEKGGEAVKVLQQRLQARLGKAMGEGGPAAAVKVCREEAPGLAAEVSRELGVKVGRTSDRLRNPANAAPAWARPFVQAAAGQKGAEVKAVAVDLGDRVGLLRPIPMGQACLRCHGAAASLPPEVQRSVAEAYPQDQAQGYAEGDHRGFFWAEVAK